MDDDNTSGEAPAVNAAALADKARRCKHLACAIQTCLKRRDYDERRCAAEIARWRQCADELAQLRKCVEAQASSKD